VILEKTGRAVLLTGMLEGGAGADHAAGRSEAAGREGDEGR
jgi:hypothetical protein